MSLNILGTRLLAHCVCHFLLLIVLASCEDVTSSLKLTASSFHSVDQVDLNDIVKRMDTLKKKLQSTRTAIQPGTNKILKSIDDLIHHAVSNNIGSVFDDSLEAIDIFKTIKQQSEIMAMVENDSIDTAVLDKHDPLIGLYPTNTQWNFLGDAVFSQLWKTEKTNHIAIEGAYQKIIYHLKEFFHARSIYLNSVLVAPLESYSSRMIGEEETQVDQVTYTIEKVPMKQITGAGHTSRIKPSQNQKFMGTTKIESITVSIEGITKGQVELSTLNMLVHSSLDVSETLVGLPSHFTCQVNEECKLDSGASWPISPYTEWKILLNEDFKGSTAHDITIKFKVHKVDKLQEFEESFEPDLSCSNEPVDVKDFVRKKYGYHTTIDGLSDYLIATDLDEINKLFNNMSPESSSDRMVMKKEFISHSDCQPKYNPITGEEKWFEVNTNISFYGVFEKPKFSFMMNNEQTLRIEWILDDSSYLTADPEYLPCNIETLNSTIFEPGPTSTKIQGGKIEAFVPLRVLSGTIDEQSSSGNLILHAESAGVSSRNFVVSCEECNDDYLGVLKDHIKDNLLRDINLATVNFNPSLEEVFKPVKFRFSTSCKDCNEKGYLIIMLCTAHGSCSEDLSDIDWAAVGLDSPLPPDYSTLIMMSDTLLWKNIILPAWNGVNANFKFGVTSYNEDKTCFKARNKMMTFSHEMPLPVLTKYYDDEKCDLHLPENTFKLRADMDHLTMTFDYSNDDDPLKSKIVYNVLKDKKECHEFSSWMWHPWKHSYDCITSGDKQWEENQNYVKAKVSVKETREYSINFNKECASFNIDGIDTELNYNPVFEPEDEKKEAKNLISNEEDLIKQELNQKLVIKAEPIKSVSLNIATGIVFPMGKEMEVEQFYVPGDVVLMGNLADANENIKMADYCP